MNILYLNNYHYIRGGAENVFFTEMELARRAGNRVNVFCRQHAQNLPVENDHFFPSEMVTDVVKPNLKSLRSVMQMVYSREAKKNLDDMLRRLPIDLAHAHNIYGRLTTSVLDCLHQKKIPVVMTLHDYKLICPNYKLMHHNHICEACKNKNYFQAVLKKCHKDSYAASAIYAAETFFNEKFEKYSKNVAFFIAPSLFLRDKLVEFGWPEKKIVYVPNFIELEKFEPNYTPGNYFLYLGRLSLEKGIDTLIRAFRALGDDTARLKIVGDGPLKEQLIDLVDSDPRIEFSGYLSGRALEDATRNALAMVIPSEWYENAPISVLEAFAYGKPVIGARIGGIPEMVESGVHGYMFEPGNILDLQQKLKMVLGSAETKISDMGQAARRRVERNYTPAIHYEKLMEVYQRAINQIR